MGIGFDRTKENILKLVEKRNRLKSPFKVRLSMALVARNEGDEKKFVEEWKDKVDSIAINRAHSYSGAVAETAGKNKIDYQSVTIPCRALFTGITIGSDGELLLCGLDYEANEGLGNIRNGKILDLYYSKKMENMRSLHLNEKVEAFEKCGKCGVPYSAGFEWFVDRII